MVLDEIAGALYQGRKLKDNERRFILLFEVLPIDDKDDYYAESARPRVKKTKTSTSARVNLSSTHYNTTIPTTKRSSNMYYQIYDNRTNSVIATCPTQEDAYSFLRLYEAGERTHLEIRPIFKDEHPLRRQGSFRRY